MASQPRPPPPPRPKTRGNYNCGRCGQPKKGHVCVAPVPVAASPSGAAPSPSPSTSSGAASASGGDQRRRRALSFDEAGTPSSPEKKPKVEPDAEMEVAGGEDDEEEDAVIEVGGRPVPREVMAEVLRRLGPRGVMAAAGVSRGWRDCAGRVWRAADELRLRVLAASGAGLLGALLPRCPALSLLQLRMESDVDATALACLAVSCPSLKTLEITMAANAVNRMTGEDLSRFVSEKSSLSVLKIGGCSNLDFINLCSSSLSVLWLSDLCSLSNSVMNCPNMSELSLCFAQQSNDCTDLVTLMDGIGCTCPNLNKMHISSNQLSNEAVFALESANLRGLSMLSLILGSKITDAAVASIVRLCTSLELLDLSGSSISDNGVGMICKAFPHTLSRLLLALCPNVTTRGIQLATAQLPHLQLMDCGMSLCANLNNDKEGPCLGEINGGIRIIRKLCTLKKQPVLQKLIIKHGNLKKLSLWGCSAIDALYVNCPQLNDLNLNSCTNLHPERLLLQCPNLKNVHAAGCQDMLVGAIRNQVLNEFAAAESSLPCKRLGDGSKRVQLPQFLQHQPSEDDKLSESSQIQCTMHRDTTRAS
ncbi:F-box/LRR-repeat protein 17-like isoform X1 [Panicum virgatum]|nr:F-box/LRR-repeat protein 17-like isoform X1 [Panicum virgatum]